MWRADDARRVRSTLSGTYTTFFSLQQTSYKSDYVCHGPYARDKYQSLGGGRMIYGKRQIEHKEAKLTALLLLLLLLLLLADAVAIVPALKD